MNETKKLRDSNFELLRIILMLVIVGHHYVVNSGIYQSIIAGTLVGWQKWFFLIVGCGGKTAINIFVMITGYFMCTSKISVGKFLKLLGQIEFYKIVIYIIFVLTGVESISLRGIVIAILPFKDIANDFSGCFIIFYLLIPFINKLINGMNKKEHTILLGILLTVFSLFPSLTGGYVSINYVEWFFVMYLLAAYIRLYDFSFAKTKCKGIVIAVLCCTCAVLSIPLSVLVLKREPFIFITDSNKLGAVIVAATVFCVFKNLKINYSKCINKIASATFGVLLIHANSDAMRQWLWSKALNNIGYVDKGWITVAHFMISVLLVYGCCVAIDLLRISFLEPIYVKFFIEKVQGKFHKYYDR